ncbi:hypothetical protein TNCV_447621 [Trichonephila clavipes]|nr:hypothetical protein TNCV_447621 [Trichonephila clavipes]
MKASQETRGGHRFPTSGLVVMVTNSSQVCHVRALVRAKYVQVPQRPHISVVWKFREEEGHNKHSFYHTMSGVSYPKGGNERGGKTARAGPAHAFGEDSLKQSVCLITDIPYGNASKEQKVAQNNLSPQVDQLKTNFDTYDIANCLHKLQYQLLTV